MIINFTEEELNILCDAGTLIYDIITCNQLENRYQEALVRILNISFELYEKNDINPAYLYDINNYLYWYIHIDRVQLDKADEEACNDVEYILTNKNIDLAQKLKKKINTLLFSQLESKVIYIDYENPFSEISKEKNDNITKRLGSETKSINLYPPLKKKILDSWEKIRGIVYSKQGLILDLDWRQYMIFQKEKIDI